MNHLVISHRGYFDNVEIIENTIPAFVNNIIDGIELDVQMTCDGIVVCYHDESLNRLHNSDIIITRSDYENLTPFSVDKFDDVLKHLSVHITKPIIINCEIKIHDKFNNDTYINKLCMKVNDIIKKYSQLHILVTSFSTKVITIMKSLSINSTMIFHEYSNEIANFLEKYADTKSIVFNKDIVNDKLIDITDDTFNKLHIYLYTYFDNDKNNEKDVYIEHHDSIRYITNDPIETHKMICDKKIDSNIK